MGRKRIDIDLDKVAELAGRGLTQGEIAACLGVSLSFIGKRKRESGEFTDAIERGKAAAAREVSNKLFELCKRGNLGAIVWYEKTRRGMSDRVSLEVDWREEARKDGIKPETLSATFEAMVEQMMAQQMEAKDNDGGSGNADV